MSPSLPSADKLCLTSNPLQWDAAKRQLMVEACRELANFHYSHCQDIKRLYDEAQFKPNTIETPADLARIPFVGVTAMKYYLLHSLPESTVALKLTSSGTSGQKTQIWFDEDSLRRVQSMMDVLWDEVGLVTDEPNNYVAFIYDPEQAKDLGIAFTAKNEMRFTPIKEAFFAVQKNASGEWEFQLEKTIARLRHFAQQETPVRLLGIPSFLFELIEEVRKQTPIALPKGSAMLIGGGWKAAEDKKISKEAFRALVSETFGIDKHRMFDLYGMAEHSAPYMTCTEHRIHIPVFNEILIRDPYTLELLPDGQTGLIELITPYNATIANLAILSTDLGYRHDEPCACGNASPTFDIVGRGGIAKHKGCAITAGEIVKR